MSLLLKYIDAPPQNPIDFKIPLSDPMDWPLIPSIQDLKKALSNNENDDSVPSYSTSEILHEKIIAIEAYLTSINFANEDSAFFTALYHTSQNFIFMNYNRAKHELSCQCGAHYTVYYDKTLKCYKIRVDKSHSHCMESTTIPTIVLDYLIESNNESFISNNFTNFHHIVQKQFKREIGKDTFRKRVKAIFHITDSDLVNSFKKLISLNNHIVESGGCSIISTGEKNDKNEYIYKVNELIEDPNFIIKCISILPPASELLLKSERFNNILLVDATRTNTICAGKMGVIATTSPTRRAIPIAYGWSVEEDLPLMSSLFKTILNKITKNDISIILSDGGTAIKGALIENGLIQKQRRCIFHLFEDVKYSKCRKIIWSLNLAINSVDYTNKLNDIKKSITENYPNYSETKIDKFIKKLKDANPFKFNSFDQGLQATSVLEALNGEFQKRKNFDIIEAFAWFTDATVKYGVEALKNCGQPKEIIDFVIKKSFSYNVHYSEIKDLFKVIDRLGFEEKILIFNGKGICSCNETKRFETVCSHIEALNNQKPELRINVDQYLNNCYTAKISDEKIEELAKMTASYKNLPAIDSLEIPERIRRDKQTRKRMPSKFEYNK